LLSCLFALVKWDGQLVLLLSLLLPSPNRQIAPVAAAQAKLSKDNTSAAAAMLSDSFQLLWIKLAVS
jgi:hypothetical protein